MAKLFLGLDSSTQSLSAVVIDLDTRKVVYEHSLNFDQALPHHKTLNGVLPNRTLDSLASLGARLVTVVPENQRVWCEQHFPDDVVVVGDHTGRLKTWFDSRPVGAVLLRPDHFIAAAGLAQQTPALVDAILQALAFTGAQAPTAATSV